MTIRGPLGTKQALTAAQNVIEQLVEFTESEAGNTQDASKLSVDEMQAYFGANRPKSYERLAEVIFDNVKKNSENGQVSTKDLNDYLSQIKKSLSFADDNGDNIFTQVERENGTELAQRIFDAGQQYRILAAASKRGWDTRKSNVMTKKFGSLEGLADELTRMSIDGALYYVSEGDDDYTGFSVDVPNGTQLTEQWLRDNLPFSVADDDGFVPDYAVLADDFALDFYRYRGDISEQGAHYAFESSRLTPEEAQAEADRYAALEEVLKDVAVRSELLGIESELYIATPSEYDYSFASILFFGQNADGDIIGVKSSRVWT